MKGVFVKLGIWNVAPIKSIAADSRVCVRAVTGSGSFGTFRDIIVEEIFVPSNGKSPSQTATHVHLQLWTRN